MWVAQLEVQDFRNHPHTSLELTSGITAFVGSNGQGKTNLVEALGYLAHLSSHRVSTDKALVRQGCEGAIIRAQVTHDQRFVELACEIKASGANRAKINGTAAPLGELAGWLKVVLFTPEDLSIIRGDPSVRRRYLDQAVASRVPRMHSVLAEYDRVIRQRNALLKSARGASNHTHNATIEGWNEALVELASDITSQRRALITALQPSVSEAYRLISGGDEVTLALESPVDAVADHQLNEGYRAELERRSREEWERGMTLVGPHRDDLDVRLNDMPGRTHSSHGEAWSLALALRMGLAQVFRHESSSGDPVIVLDDVFAELDATRRTRLQTVVADFEQVLVTAAVREDIPQEFAGHTFSVSQGVVSGV